MAAIETGSSTAWMANVDAQYNIMTNSPWYTSAGVVAGGWPAQAGGSTIYTANDEWTVTWSRNVKSPKTSLHRRLRVGIDTMLFNDTFNAITQNTNIWSYTFATLTASQPWAGTVNFGTVQGTLLTHGAFMRTFQYFPLFWKASLATKFSLGIFNSTLVANEEWRCGYGLPTVAWTAPTDGVWFLLTTAGLYGKSYYSGVETTTSMLASLASFTVGTIYTLEIIIGEQEAEFWRNGILLGTLNNAAANGQPFQPASYPLFMQKLCTGNVTNTNTIRVSDINVYISDIATNKDWNWQLATAGQWGNVGQNGQTQGKTSLWTNNTAPTAVALTNTAAAFTWLGGIVAVLPTLAVASDWKLITYQNPASTINITGRNLLIKGVWLQGAVSVILTGWPVTYAYALAYGHTATTLATAETGSFVTATTHAPRILPLGMDNFIVTAPAGTLWNAIYRTLDVPIVVRPWEFVDIIARNIGVVTTLGAITFTIWFNAYWE